MIAVANTLTFVFSGVALIFCGLTIRDMRRAQDASIDDA